MRKRTQKGRMSQVDFALIIHEALDLPLDPVTRRPKLGLKIVKAMQKAMTEALRRGEEVTVRGFGKFHISEGRKRYHVPKPAVFNPGVFGHKYTVYSDEPLFLPARKRVVFQPSVQLTAMLNVDDNPNYDEKYRAIDKW